RLHPGGGLAERVERRVHGPDEPLALLVDDREVEVELRGEVAVEHRFADAGAVGDVVHRDVVVPLRGEELLGDRQELGPARVPRHAGARGGGRRGRVARVSAGSRHGGRIRKPLLVSTPCREEWDDGRVPDRQSLPNRSTAPRAARPPRGLRHGAAVAACLVLGFGGGAATAEVWDVPHPRGASPEAAASRQDPPAPVREEDDAASRSAVGRAGAAASAPERAPALDLLAPRPDAITAPDPAPSAEPGMTTPEPPVAEQPPEPPVADPGSGLLGDVVVAPDLGGALAVVPGESPAPGGGTVRSVRVEVEEGLPVDGEVFATAVL